MEKMITPRYTIANRTQDRYADRILPGAIPPRGNQVTEESADTKKPLWRGDHTFSSDAAKYSLEHFIEPDVAREHPNWTKDQVRATAFSRFEKRLAQDLTYEQKETAHIETAVDWHIVEVVPGVKELATEYGGKQVTLRELWEHTKEYAAFVGNPAAYNKAEEQTQMAMQDMFIRGNADTFVSVLSHPDSVRYVQVWERQEDAIVSKQVDVYAATGRDFSHEEGNNLIRHLQQLEEERHQGTVVVGDATYAHFFVKNGTLGESDITTIAQMQSMHSTFGDRLPVLPEKRWTPLVGQIAVDTVDAMTALGTYVKDSIDLTVQALMRDHVRTTAHITVPKYVETDGPTRGADYQRVLFTHGATGEMVASKESGSEIMRGMLAEWFVSKKTLEYAAVTPEGSGAALFWLRFLAAGPRPEISHQPVIGRREKRHTSEVSESLRKKKDTRRSLWKRFHNRMTRLVEQRPLVKVIPKTATKTDRSVNTHRKERLRQLTRLERITLDTWCVLRAMASSFKHERVKRGRTMVLSNRQAPSHEKKRFLQSDKRKQTEHRLRFGLLVWWFFAIPKTAERNVQVKKTTQREKDNKAHASPWVLLAIIWHLAMIRESGGAGSRFAGRDAPRSKKKKTKIARRHNLNYYTSLPTRGIIYPPFMIE